ncbi:hypothetical protein ACGIF2_04685 [Cellulomonas sp. P22]|uniref:hypothetical protein n=1 Tax=Cellulomonas sp. P22 TaxID=3373189 RepID=UPI0037B4B2F9
MARPAGARTRRRSLVAAVALTALLALYLWVVTARALALLRTGEPVAIGLGAAILVLPVLAVWAIGREWRLALEVQAMADELAEAGRLPLDDLPRSPGGRIDRAAATDAFAAARAEAEQSPDDWGTWYRLAFAYDAAGDRRRAREALRIAARLHRA